MLSHALALEDLTYTNAVCTNHEVVVDFLAICECDGVGLEIDIGARVIEEELRGLTLSVASCCC